MDPDLDHALKEITMQLHPICRRLARFWVGPALAIASGGCREAIAPSDAGGPNASIKPPPGPTPPPGSTTQQIAFVSNRDGNYEIYRIFANGGGLKRLTVDSAEDLQPTWSPDGQKLAFVRAGQIYAMNQNGSGQTNLSNSTTADADPVWSPGGQKILFRRYLTVGSRWIVFKNWEVFVMNADGSGQTNLSQSTPLVYDGQARWSPDGSQIVFVSERDGNREIYRMDADGGNKARLTTDSLEDIDPQWRPTGDRIAFLRRVSPYNNDPSYHLYLMNPDGSNLVEPNPALDPVLSATWSPDGMRLGAVDEEQGLHVLTAEGASVYYDASADTHYPPVAWSPNSNAIAMTQDPGGAYGNYDDIFVLNDADLKAGTEGTNITNSPGFDYQPAWRP